VKVILEKRRYLATKMTVGRVEDPPDGESNWETLEVLEDTLWDQETVKEYELHKGSQIQMEDAYNETILRLDTQVLTKAQAKEIAQSIACGFEQPEWPKNSPEKDLYDLALKISQGETSDVERFAKTVLELFDTERTDLAKALIISEIAHSMNRFGMLAADNVQEFIDMVKPR